jgi:hypothetical protein
VFMDIRAKKADIIKAGCEVFELVFHGKPPKDLGDLRFDIFSKWAAAGTIKPEKLPPTIGAAAQQSLRVYLHTRDWLVLKTASLEIQDYRWKLADQGYGPVPSIDPIEPDYLLTFVSCNCEGNYSTLRCYCKKQGVNCFSACGNCSGNSCKNIKKPEDQRSEGDAEELDE